ncbi:MAG TPA: hypothetical protein GX499_06155 [Clostridiales bacterium]|nr:hypothetical protein [Clostridiales bacterium]
MKSIKLKLITLFTLVIFLVTLCLGFVSIVITKNTLLETALYDLEVMASSEAKYMAAKLDAEMRYVDALAQNSTIISEAVPIGRKIGLCEAEAQRSGYIYFATVDAKGKAQVLTEDKPTYNVSNEEFFQKAISGELALSDLFFDENNRPIFTIAAPIVINGRQTGVFFGRKDGMALSQMVGEISYKETGYAYLINNEGTAVAHPNSEWVTSQNNLIAQAETNPDYADLAAIAQHMITREVGSGSYDFEGTNKLWAMPPSKALLGFLFWRWNRPKYWLKSTL